MRKFIAFCLGSLIVAGPVLAASTPPLVLADRDRPVTGGRAVLVELPQTEIDVAVDVGRVMSDTVYGGGLLGALILSSNDHKREALTGIDTRRATSDAAPLRRAMLDFDFDRRATESTRSALARLDWFGAQEPKAIKLASGGEREAFVQAAGTQQLATVTYHYSLSPDFTQIQVVADVALWRPAAARARGAPATPVALYRLRIAAIAELRNRSYDHAENAAQWSAANGNLAKASITGALARLEQLIPFALGLRQADITALDGAKTGKLFAAGYYGPQVSAFPNAPGETLIWSQGLIEVMPAPATSANGGAQ